MSPYRRVKPLLDRVLAAAGIVVLAPLLTAIALRVYLDDGGPIIYRHRRVGHNGVPFDCFKFRTMRAGADRLIEQWRAEGNQLWKEFEASNYKLQHDPRVTRIGEFLRRSSLDELPQLFNVLGGAMSLVGPRPVTAEEVELYGQSKCNYLSVVPGLTGAWQVSGRSDTSFEFRVRCDDAYCKNVTFVNDLLILLRTVWVVAMRRGAY
ncbi:sugar transferase [Paraburkholderia sp. UCT31]|uniref:sugar transferase n=1 Tax=Paraburkholderia sp. UCT31 TaxID=2615209 RepID=UPI00165627D9|nr:sugar transferase [Paraburkholderia sp. UCT31]MBC8738483.1 sugar transferase [Paraburkholderia sp. UCT31]